MVRGQQRAKPLPQQILELELQIMENKELITKPVILCPADENISQVSQGGCYVPPGLLEQTCTGGSQGVE